MILSNINMQPFIVPFVFAISGACVRFILSKDEKRFLSFFANTLTGIFTGALIYCFSGSIETFEIRCGLVGLASYCGGDLLPVLAKILQKRVEKEGDK